MQFSRKINSSNNFYLIEDKKNQILESIRDILTTPKGTRIMRPEYGSRIFELLDRPLTPQTILDIIYETATSIARWEPRVKLIRVQIASVTSNSVKISLTGRLITNNTEKDFSVSMELLR
jgi:phage baseplate assembly protein W